MSCKFPLYSKVIQIYIDRYRYRYFFLFFSIRVYYMILNIVACILQ